MAAASDQKLGDFLVDGFSRVGKKSAQEMCDKAGLKSAVKVKGLTANELKSTPRSNAGSCGSCSTVNSVPLTHW